jgi:hypothetical protein
MHLITRGMLVESECLHVFLGIDEYQSIEDVKGVKRTKMGGLLQDFTRFSGRHFGIAC